MVYSITISYITPNTGANQTMNGYIAFYRGRKLEVQAETSYQAQIKAAASFKAKKSYEVTVMLAEIDDKEVIHHPDF